MGSSNSKAINCLSHIAEFDYVRKYYKDDPEILISPDPTMIKRIEVEHCYQPFSMLTKVVVRPKSVIFAGSYVENWILCLN